MILVSWELYKRQYYRSSRSGKTKYLERCEKKCKYLFYTMDGCMMDFEEYAETHSLPEYYSVRFVVHDDKEEPETDGMVDVETHDPKFKWRCYRIDPHEEYFGQAYKEFKMRESEEIFSTYAECMADFKSKYGHYSMHPVIDKRFVNVEAIIDEDEDGFERCKSESEDSCLEVAP